MGLRTWATSTKKLIAGRRRFSGHSGDKHSKDLLACPDQIHSDRGAPHSVGVVMNACVYVIQFYFKLHSHKIWTRLRREAPCEGLHLQ